MPSRLSRRTPRLLQLGAAPIWFAGLLAGQAPPADSWTSWRGPLGTGVAPNANPPVTWSEKENIRFKVELPGYGYGTPIVQGDLVFLSAAQPFGPELEPVPDDAPGAHDNARVTHEHQFLALAVNAKTGKIEWQTPLHEQLPHAGFHKSSALAAASMVTDGEHCFAFFGSYGLYCLTVDGELVWKKDLGDMNIKHGHGEGVSPLLHGDTLVVNWDHEGQSFIVAFDKATGEQRWRKQRDEVTSWSTPIAVEHDGKVQVVVSGTGYVRAYDLETGDVIWKCRGLSHNVCASPVAGDGYVYAGSSYEKRRMFAIRLEGAKGDVTNTDNVVWRRQRGTPYVPSPLLYGEWLYFLNHYQGFLTRVHAKTGREAHRPIRVGMRAIYASPVGAAERIYLTDREGVTLVLAHPANEATAKVLARNVLADSFSASAAVVGDAIYMRGWKHLYCIAEK